MFSGREKNSQEMSYSKGELLRMQILVAPEQGSILGEDSDDDKDMMLNKEQLRDLMFETSKEVVRPYDFKTNDLCMFAGYSNIEDGRQ